jgi:hypothetical protein
VKWIPGDSLSPDEEAALIAVDPLLTGVSVVDPFPGSALGDVIELIHRRLGLAAETSRQALRKGCWADAFARTGQRQVVVIDAHLLAPGVIDALNGLLRAGLPGSPLIVSLTGGNSEQMRAIAPCARLEVVSAADIPTKRDVSVPPAVRLMDLAPGLVSDVWLSRVASVADFVDYHFDHIGPQFLELSALWAGLALFEAPCDFAGGLLRLHGLELCLSRRGVRMRGEMDDLVAAAMTHPPDAWLRAALALEPPRMPRLRVPVAANPREFNDDAITEWVARLRQPSTRRSYRTVLDDVMRWRCHMSISSRDHSFHHLTDWAYWRATRGTAQRTLARGLAIATRFTIFLLTGVDVPAHAAYLRVERPARIEFDPELQARLRSLDAGVRARERGLQLVSGGKRPPLASPTARALLQVVESDETRLWQLIDRVALKYGDPALEPIRCCSATSARFVRNVSCLNGALVVLTTGIGWHQLPAELGYGSGRTARLAIAEWHNSGIWSEIEAALRGRHALRNADWGRARTLRPLHERGVPRE